MDDIDPNKITSPQLTKDDVQTEIDSSLRPQNFNEIIGRDNEVENLSILINAARKRKESIDHVLLHGPPGLGKTSLAYVIANEASIPIYTTSGPAIERKADLASILTNIETNSILFIDEIHRLRTSFEELLYSAMEDSSLDIIIGKGPSARTLKLELNKFTLIGATTRVSMLSNPLRDRFGMDLRLDYYSIEDLTELVLVKAKILGINIEKDAAVEIAKRSRRTPRIAQRLLKRVRDYVEVKEKDKVELDDVNDCMRLLGIDVNGLDKLDKRILLTIRDNFNGGPVGIKTLSASLAEDLETIETVYEPYLIKEGFLIRTPRGRVLSEKSLPIIEKL